MLKYVSEYIFLSLTYVRKNKLDGIYTIEILAM